MAQKPTYDKVDPIVGSFRGRLAADLTLVDGSFFGAVSLNASGRVVVGTAGQSGLVGVVVKNVVRQPVSRYGTPPGSPGLSFIGARAGEQVDIMQFGEIQADKTAFPAGSKVYTTTAGVISTTGGTGKFLIGHTVEAGRIRINCPVGLVAQA